MKVVADDGFAGINHLLPSFGMSRLGFPHLYRSRMNRTSVLQGPRRSHAQISRRLWQSQEPAEDLNFALVQTDPRVDAVYSIRGRREWAQRFATA
jgi:hypothetical protein